MIVPADSPHSSPSDHAGEPTRRSFVTTALMIAGLAAGYGLGAWHFFRYLVPLKRRTPKREILIGTLADLPVGSSITVKDPRGQDIAVTRVSESPADPAGGFKALSSKCPHLGCRVHWEAANDRFFCPCHDGVFDKNGVAREGPPAKEGKNLSTFEVRVNKDNGWVYLMVTEAPKYGV